MTPPRLALLPVSAIAAFLALRRPALRPVAVALLAMAGVDLARAYGLPARLDVAAWCAWPWATSALAWAVWRRGNVPRK